MTTDVLQNLVRDIVSDAKRLVASRTSRGNAPVNYACVFAHSEEEYLDLLKAAGELGTVVEETKMGPVFLILPLQTSAGPLRLLKIRKPDPERTERGDADFTVSNYDAFKSIYLHAPGFKLIERPKMEMMELSDPSFSVLAYFSHPTLMEVLGIDSNE